MEKKVPPPKPPRLSTIQPLKLKPETPKRPSLSDENKDDETKNKTTENSTETTNNVRLTDDTKGSHTVKGENSSKNYNRVLDELGTKKRFGVLHATKSLDTLDEAHAIDDGKIESSTLYFHEEDYIIEEKSSEEHIRPRSFSAHQLSNNVGKLFQAVVNQSLEDGKVNFIKGGMEDEKLLLLEEKSLDTLAKNSPTLEKRNVPKHLSLEEEDSDRGIEDSDDETSVVFLYKSGLPDL